MRNPYKFPARSRADMIAAMESIGGRYESGARHPFAWNVKIYDWPDDSAAGLAAQIADLNPAWDSAWREYVESRDSLFWQICEDMGRTYVDGEYCTWPGDDHGQYHFEFHGRSGGWLVLTKWRGRSLRGFSIADDCAADEFASLAWQEVRELYRATATMSQDFASEKLREDMAWHVADARVRWEERRREAIADNRAAQVESASAALALLHEFRAARAAWAGRGGLGAVPVICATLRQAIIARIAGARAHGRAAWQLEAGVVS